MLKENIDDACDRVGGMGNIFMYIYFPNMQQETSEAKVQHEHYLLISSSSTFFPLTNDTTVPPTCFLFAQKSVVYKFALIK